MKKICYIFSALIFFLFFKSNVFATGKVILNYDSFYDLIDDYPVYTEIISGIRQRLDNSDYRYAIFITGTNYSSCAVSYGAWNQSEYESFCNISSVMSHGGFKLTVNIFNPIYYNTDDSIQYLYFAVGSGSSSSYPKIGLVMGSVYNSSTVNITPNNLQVSSYDYNISISSVNDLSLIDSWLSNPIFNNRTSKYSSVGNSSDSLTWTTSTIPWYVYKNFKTLNKYTYLSGSSQGTNNAQYILNGVTNTFEVNEETEFIIARNQILPPIVNDLGEGTTTFNGNSIKISSLNFDSPVICPITRNFNDDFCYIYNTDFISGTNIVNSNLHLDFDLGNTYVSFTQGHYYSFTFRVSSTSTLNVSAMGINSGQISTNVVISQVIKHENGVFTDYQIIFTPNSSFTSSYTLSRIYIIFNGFVESDYDSYSYGVYRNYRYHDFGTSQPSSYDINNDYTINNIDSITSDTSNWFNNLHLKDRGLSQFVTAPLRILNYIIANKNTACSVFTFTLPYFNTNVTFACMSNVIGNYFPNLLALYQLIIGGILTYYIAICYVHTINRVTNPDYDNIEVINL